MLRGQFGRQPESGIERGALNGRQLGGAPALGPEQLVQSGAAWGQRYYRRAPSGICSGTSTGA